MSSAVPSDRCVLFVCADRLLPCSGGGGARVLALIDHLRASGHRVELATFDHGKAANAELMARVDRLWCMPALEDRAPGGLSAAAAQVVARARSLLRDRLPEATRQRLRAWRDHVVPAKRREPREPKSLIERKHDPAFCEFAAAIAREIQPVAAVAEFVWTARSLDGMPDDVLRMIDTLDIQHRRARLAKEAGGALPGHRCTRAEEIAELERADVLIAIEPGEAEVLREMCPGREVIVVGHAAPRSQLPARTSSDGQRLFFVGNLYDPNVRGLQQFLSDTWPALRAALPDLALDVCGRVCEAFPVPIEGVVFHGVAEELGPYYERAAIAINPCPYGSGLKIKTVEALGHGKCVVATDAAVAGLPNEARAAVRRVEAPGDMAPVLLELLRDPAARRAQEKRAKDYTAHSLAGAVVYAPIEGCIRAASPATASAPGRA